MRLYLDTSVISAYFDTEKVSRYNKTKHWFDQMSQQDDLFISDLVLEELEATKNIDLKNAFIHFVTERDIAILEITDEITSLAAIYRNSVIPDEYNDSIHIAAATLYEFEAILSWNFKHIVNLNTIRLIHEINIKNGHSLIEIISLNEMVGEDYE